MDPNRKGNLVLGILLVLAGAWFLAQQFFPQLNELIKIDVEWPLLIIGVGLFFLLMSVLLRSPGLAVPASIVGGMGAIFYYQNLSGDWASWSYAWTLIPGFVGIGLFLSYLLQGQLGAAVRESAGLLVFSLLMFGVFSGLLGGPQVFARLWPLFLIGAGVWTLLRNTRIRRRNRTSPDIIEH